MYILTFCRLSKIASDLVTMDNPNVVDLSDSNRPAKLGEQLSDLYDNEWTDAFESLDAGGYTEEEAIETLRLTLVVNALPNIFYNSKL